MSIPNPSHSIETTAVIPESNQNPAGNIGSVILDTRPRNRSGLRVFYNGGASRISLGLWVILLLFTTTLTTLAQSREQDYLRVYYGKYSFVYCPEDSAFIAPLWNELRNRIPIVEHQLHLNLVDSARFVITPSEREWARVTAGSPLWANGIAYPSRGIAVLKSPSFGKKYGSPFAPSPPSMSTYIC